MINSFLLTYYGVATKNRDKGLRCLNGMRFARGGYEYKLTYSGGFAPCLSADRRKVGTRNFKYCSIGEIDLDKYRDAESVLNEVYKVIDSGKVW